MSVTHAHVSSSPSSVEVDVEVDVDVEDPTVASPSTLLALKESTGVDLSAIPLSQKLFIRDQSRTAGNRAFASREFQEAINLYSQAIAADPLDKTLFANRSAAYLAQGRAEEAYQDALKAVKLSEGKWTKAFYRMGCAALARMENKDALMAFNAGLQLEPLNEELRKKQKVANKRHRKEAKRLISEVRTQRKDLVLALREARRDDTKLLMMNQYKQAMSSPDWDVEDFDWRPTFLPRMRQTKIDADITKQTKAHITSIAGYVRSLGELEAPKPCLASYDDADRLSAYTKQITHVLSSRPGAHVLAISGGGGTIALTCASAAAAAATSADDMAVVSVAERSRSLYRMTKQILRSNRKRCLRIRGEDEVAVPLSQVVTLLDRPLHRVRSDEEAEAAAKEESDHDVTTTKSDGTSNGDGDDDDDGEGWCTLSHGPADVLATDAFDALVLGARVIPMVRDAARRGLCRVGCRIVPAKVRVYAIASSMRVGTISDLDLSSLNVYRWHPNIEACRLDAETTPRHDVTDPFLLCEIDMQRILDASLARRQQQRNTEEEDVKKRKARTAPAEFMHDEVVSARAIAKGKCNALCIFFVLDFHGDGTLCATNWREGRRRLRASGLEHKGGELGLLTSVPQSVQYLDNFDIRTVGDAIPIRVQHDGAMLVLSHDSMPSVRPRHAYIPKWHYDMLFDSQRNDAYEMALKRSIASVRTGKGLRPLAPAAVDANGVDIVDDPRDNSWEARARRAVRLGKSPPPPPPRIAGWTSDKSANQEVLVLDVGAGTGILSMLAARHGADKVIGCEQSLHMCDVGEECEVLNGYATQCLLLNKDVRRMLCKDDPLLEKTGGVKPDGTAPELERRADVLVYEVFDSGLIGEGALHLVHHARSKLLTKDARLVPMGATVYAQPICMRTTTINCGDESFDVSCTNRYRWRPDYEGIELGSSEHSSSWIALAEPTEVFTFDFYESALNMQPLERLVTFDVDPNTCEQIGRARSKLARLMREQREREDGGHKEKKPEKVDVPPPPPKEKKPPAEHIDDCDTDDDDDDEEEEKKEGEEEEDAAGLSSTIQREDADFEASVKAAISRLPPDELDDNGPPLVCNAIAFWFELHMDETTTLTTSPYAASKGNRKGPTWQQAVQFVEERAVRVGQDLEVRAKHDTYGISFELAPVVDVSDFSSDTGIPLFDASWDVDRQRMEAVNGNLARAVVQSPLEFRKCAGAAVELAARPQDFELDPQHAARFCQRMLS